MCFSLEIQLYLKKKTTVKFLSNHIYVVFIIVNYRDVLRSNFQVLFWMVKTTFAPFFISENAVIIIQCFSSLGSVTVLEILYYWTLSMIFYYTQQ